MMLAAAAVACGLAVASLTPATAASPEYYLEVEEDACESLVAHVPDDNVTYRPGVDVHGNPVVPADRYPSPTISDTIVIPLELDLFDVFGIPADPKLVEGTILLGTVRLEHGRVTYNGQDLSDPQSRALAELCRRQDRP